MTVTLSVMGMTRNSQIVIGNKPTLNDKSKTSVKFVMTELILLDLLPENVYYHFFTGSLTELPNTDYGLLLRRRGPLQPIRTENA